MSAKELCRPAIQSDNKPANVIDRPGATLSLESPQENSAVPLRGHLARRVQDERPLFAGTTKSQDEWECETNIEED